MLSALVLAAGSASCARPESPGTPSPQVVDQHNGSATIEDETKPERFVSAAQAILMLGLREDQEGRDLVNAELRADEVKLGINDHALDAIITDLRHES
jgi:hypothetical protein